MKGNFENSSSPLGARLGGADQGKCSRLNSARFQDIDKAGMGRLSSKPRGAIGGEGSSSCFKSMGSRFSQLENFEDLM